MHKHSSKIEYKAFCNKIVKKFQNCTYDQNFARNQILNATKLFNFY